MLYRYETLILTVPEVTQDELQKIESEIDRLVQMQKGTLLSFERWGKYRLAYPIRKNEYGIYCLVRFEMPHTNTTLINDLKALFLVKLNTIIVRNFIARLAPHASLAYQRPKSLEESPASRDVSSFLKENKMEGLLSSVEPTARHAESLQTEGTIVDDEVEL